MEQIIMGGSEFDMNDETAQQDPAYHRGEPVYMRPLGDMQSIIKTNLQLQRDRLNLGDYTPASEQRMHTMPSAPKDIGGIALRFNN